MADAKITPENNEVLILENAKIGQLKNTTIVIDTLNTYLYLVLGSGKALRYGIGVGREGFTWSGIERISRLA